MNPIFNTLNTTNHILVFDSNDILSKGLVLEDMYTLLPTKSKNIVHIHENHLASYGVKFDYIINFDGISRLQQISQLASIYQSKVINIFNKYTPPIRPEDLLLNIALLSQCQNYCFDIDLNLTTLKIEKLECLEKLAL
jgi:hypothetical protein